MGARGWKKSRGGYDMNPSSLWGRRGGGWAWFPPSPSRPKPLPAIDFRSPSSNRAGSGRTLRCCKVPFSPRAGPACIAPPQNATGPATIEGSGAGLLPLSGLDYFTLARHVVRLASSATVQGLAVTGFRLAINLPRSSRPSIAQPARPSGTATVRLLPIWRFGTVPL